MPGDSPEFNRRGIGTCPRCGKVRFKTRDDARNAKRIIHPGEKMSTYECLGYWHYGHSDLWRDMPVVPVYEPLPASARTQIAAMARLTIGVAA